MSRLSGKYEDMGDVVIHTEWLLKGRHWRLIFHVGSQSDLSPDERPTPEPSAITFHPERIDLIMDLQADKKVELAAAFEDEVGNPVTAPEGTTFDWSVDNTAVVALTVNPDNSATAAATGLLGNAVVSLTVTLPTGAPVSGDLLLSVVPGDAERVVIVPGAVSEVTPDV